LLTNRGVDISGSIHDVTGFAILGVTAALLAVLAIQLETREEPPPAPAVTPGPATAPRGLYKLFWGGSVPTLALAGFFYVNSRPSGQPAPDAPALVTLLPAEAPGWQVTTPNDLYQFSSILGTTHLLERTYVRPAGDGQFVQLSVYVAYWPPGQASVSRVASHTPDACWPGAGWVAQPTALGRTQAIGAEFSPAEYRLFSNEGRYIQHVWFWHIFDGRVISYRDPYSLPALIRIALQYGFRRQGSQYFIRVSSNRPWEEINREPVLREILGNLDRIGL
jgi:hypothetical protein